MGSLRFRSQVKIIIKPMMNIFNFVDFKLRWENNYEIEKIFCQDEIPTAACSPHCSIGLGNPGQG
jgi:hypothetical protein